MLTASSAFAGDKACCAQGVSKADSMACVDLATLNLTPDQKTKIETWQAQCMKAGCTKERRQTFLKQARGILYGAVREGFEPSVAFWATAL